MVSQFSIHILILLASLVFILISSQYTIRRASIIANSLGLARYVVGFIIVAVISIIPETFIAITSAQEGVASFGLATLFGSNVADLTLVIAIILFVHGKSIRVESRVLKSNEFYIATLLIPLVFGLDGMYSRVDGMLLLATGIFFHMRLFWDHRASGMPIFHRKHTRTIIRNLALLFIGMACVLIGSHFIVQAGINIATTLAISPMLIGIFIGIGTTIPELSFSINALHKHDDSLALGDILGTVITDATAVVGIVALVTPFSFHPKIISVTGMFMLFAALALFYFMRSGKAITRREGAALAILYGLFVFVELIVGNI